MLKQIIYNISYWVCLLFMGFKYLKDFEVSTFNPLIEYMLDVDIIVY